MLKDHIERERDKERVYPADLASAAQPAFIHHGDEIADAAGRAWQPAPNPAPIPYAECAQTINSRPSLAQEARKNFHAHSEQAQKHANAMDFLEAHPEFDRFVQLVRQGAIQF